MHRKENGGDESTRSSIWPLRRRVQVHEHVTLHSTAPPRKEGPTTRLESWAMNFRNCYLWATTTKALYYWTKVRLFFLFAEDAHMF